MAIDKLKRILQVNGHSSLNTTDAAFSLRLPKLIWLTWRSSNPRNAESIADWYREIPEEHHAAVISEFAPDSNEGAEEDPISGNYVIRRLRKRTPI